MSISDNRSNSPCYSYPGKDEDIISIIPLDIYKDNRGRSTSLCMDKNDQQYVYVSSPQLVGHIVAYGRTAGLSSEQVCTVMEHYDADVYISDGLYHSERADIRKRMTQHYRSAEVYFLAALQSQRALTEHECATQKSDTVEDKSVCHIIANVTVQCMLNHMTLQFIMGSNAASNAMTALHGAQARFAISEQRLLATCHTLNDKQATTADLQGGSGRAQAGVSPELEARWGSYDEKYAQLHKAAAPVMAGLAQQAAAIARMRGIGRAIIEEEPATAGYGEKCNFSSSESEKAKKIHKRNLMARDVNLAFGNTPNMASILRQKAHKDANHRGEGGIEAGGNWKTQKRKRANSAPCGGQKGIPNDLSLAKQTRLKAYINFMRNTADSVGNLRLGSSVGNGLVGAGFDMPLTHDLKPTKQGEHLLKALQAYGLSELTIAEKKTDGGSPYTTGIFSTDKDGKRLASSRQIESVPEIFLDGFKLAR